MPVCRNCTARRNSKKQAAKKFPHLAALDAIELKALLKRSTLSREDRQIAVSCLIWDMNYADIAAAVHMDRTTVSRRMRNVIAPQLERLLEKDKVRAGAKCSGFFIFGGKVGMYTYIPCNQSCNLIAT